MKAFARTNANRQEVRFMEVPKPNIQSNEVLIKVEAFGVGIHDRYYIPEDAKFPYVIGTEGAGMIIEIGVDVSNFKVGDKVIFTTALQPQGGSWAEFAAVKQSTLILLPNNLSFTEGASLPVAGRTALESMYDLQLEQGDTLFIAGASGAIGSLVIQMAFLKGIRVASSASPKNHEFMESLGAEKTVDYNDPNWINQIKEWSNGGVTAALAIQPDTGKDSIQVVKENGKLITVSGGQNAISPQRNIDIQQMGHRPNSDQKLKDFVKEVSQGNIKTFIEKEFPFEKALEALKKTETRHARGKSVVKVNR